MCKDVMATPLALRFVRCYSLNAHALCKNMATDCNIRTLTDYPDEEKQGSQLAKHHPF